MTSAALACNLCSSGPGALLHLLELLGLGEVGRPHSGFRAGTFDRLLERLQIVTKARKPIPSIHSLSEKDDSRKVNFRCTEFSEIADNKFFSETLSLKGIYKRIEVL
jgi:hypothetical protein